MNQEASQSNKSLRKLILHTQDGAIPYLSPYLLKTYFSPETNHLVQNHLIIGIPIKDTCVVPKVATAATTTTAAVSLLQGKKPPTICSGYTFQPISILNRLRILPGYSTLILPTFDLMDDYDHNKGVKKNQKKNQTKKRKQNPKEEEDDEDAVDPHGNYQKEYDTSFLLNHNEDLITQSLSIPTSSFANNKHVSLVTPHGIQKITPHEYLSLIVNDDDNDDDSNHHQQQQQHTVVVGLFDQLQGHEGDKQRKQFLQRMIDWTTITTCLEKANERQKLLFWIPIDIHLTTSEREFYIHSILSKKQQKQEEEEEQNSLSHFIFLGWHRMYSTITCTNTIFNNRTKTDIRNKRRDVLLQQINHLQFLTTNMNKNHTKSNNDEESNTCYHSIKTAILCTQDLSQFMDALQCGVDCIGSNLCQRYAQEGKALCILSTTCDEKKEIKTNINTVVRGKEEEDDDDDDDNESLLWIMDMTNPQYIRDRDPLIPGCLCLACKNRTHSRAYIYHLIQAHELLAQILLFGHNLHQMLLLLENYGNTEIPWEN